MSRGSLRAIVLLTSLTVCRVALAQTPVPFPRPGDPQKPTQNPPIARPAPPPSTDEAAPTEKTLGVPIFPTAQFIASYDAGRGQRYYLFGANASFTDVV